MVIHDADLEYDPKDILKMVEKSKFSPNSLIWGQDSKVTKLGIIFTKEHIMRINLCLYYFHLF